MTDEESHRKAFGALERELGADGLACSCASGGPVAVATPANASTGRRNSRWTPSSSRFRRTEAASKLR